MDLLELRKEIDRIDDQLIPLLMARMDVRLVVQVIINIVNNAIIYAGGLAHRAECRPEGRHGRGFHCRRRPRHFR